MSESKWSKAVAEVTERRHRRTVDELEADRAKLLAIVDEKDAQLEAALAINAKPKASVIKVADMAVGEEATAVAVASDWHVEETVDPKTINGLNAFNLDIAEQRIEAFFKNVVRLTQIQRQGVKIDRLVLILGGDMMTGYIHDELREGNALSPTQTVLWLQDRIASGVEFLGKHFAEITIPCVYGNHGRCHDMETELLTWDGWKRYNEIEAGDVAATYNMETGGCEWQPLESVYVDSYQGEMIHVTNTCVDFMVTPQHRMVLKNVGSGGTKFMEMQDITKNTFGHWHIPKTANGHDNDYPEVTDDELRLLGWIWTDGSIARYKNAVAYRIHQSKEAGCAAIRDLLASLGYTYGVHSRHRGLPTIKGVRCKSALTGHAFSISQTHSPRLVELMPHKDTLPVWFKYLSARQVAVFMDTVKAGNGSVGSNPSGFYEISGKKHSLDALQALLMANGVSSRVRQDARGDFVLSVRSTESTAIQRGTWDETVVIEEYSGIIWCGSVANGTLITRRNGIPLISGNSTLKPRHATGAANSYEWMMYHVLAKQLKGKANWHISDGYHLLLDLYGRTLRVHHGDGLKYQGGIGGLTIPVEKAIAAWNKGIAADLDIFGHWHQSQQNPKWVCNGCFTGEAKVMTPNGVVEIRDIKEGDAVFAHDGSVQTVEATLQKISDEGLIEIRAKGLPDFVRCTPNHEFFAIKGESQLRQRLSPMKTYPNKEKPRWIKAEDLSEGDWVCTPELKGGREYDKDLLWVYGLFVAEGCALLGAGAKGYVNRITFTMHIDEFPVLERAKAILDKHFGKPGYIYTREKKTTSGLEYCGKELAEQWREWFGHTCYEKKVPEWVFGLTKDCREAFVQGWFDGDGHRKGQKGGTTTSRQLAWGIHWLSSGTSFNSMLYLRNKRPKGHVKGFCESYCLGFVKGQDVAFVDGHRFVRIDYRGRTDEAVPVFDLQVSGPHTYNVGGMGVHNSLIGYNAYSVAIKAPYEPPTQTYFLFDERHGRTGTFPIFLDKL